MLTQRRMYAIEEGGVVLVLEGSCLRLGAVARISASAGRNLSGVGCDEE
jgi:hypothetical protein